MHSKEGKADPSGPAPVSGVLPPADQPPGPLTENSMIASVNIILAGVQEKVAVVNDDADAHSRATLPTIRLPNAPEKSPDAEWLLLKACLAEAGLLYEDGFPLVDHIAEEARDYLFRGLSFGIAHDRFSGEAKQAAQRYMVMIEQAKRDSIHPTTTPTALRSAGATTKENPMGTKEPAAGPVPAPASAQDPEDTPDSERESMFPEAEEFSDTSIPPPSTSKDAPHSVVPDSDDGGDDGKGADDDLKPAPGAGRKIGVLMRPPPRTDSSVSKDLATAVMGQPAASPQGNAPQSPRPSRPPPRSPHPDTEADAKTLLRPSTRPPGASETIDAPTLVLRPSQPPPAPAAPNVDASAQPVRTSKAPPPPSARAAAPPHRRRPGSTGKTPAEDRSEKWRQAAAQDEGIRSDLPPSPAGTSDPVRLPSVPPPAPAAGLDGTHTALLEQKMNALAALMDAAASNLDQGKAMPAHASIQLAQNEIEKIESFVSAAAVPEQTRLNFTQRLTRSQERLKALRQRLDDVQNAAKKPEEPKPVPAPQPPTQQGRDHMADQRIGKPVQAGNGSKDQAPKGPSPQPNKPTSGKLWKALALLTLIGVIAVWISSPTTETATPHVWSGETCRPVTAELLKKYFHQSDPTRLASVAEPGPGDPHIDTGGKTLQPVGQIIASAYDVSAYKICGINKNPNTCADATAENLKKYFSQNDPAHVVQVEVPSPDDPYIETHGDKLTPVEQRTLNVYDVSNAKVCTSK